MDVRFDDLCLPHRPVKLLTAATPHPPTPPLVYAARINSTYCVRATITEVMAPAPGNKVRKVADYPGNGVLTNIADVNWCGSVGKLTLIHVDKVYDIKPWLK